MRKIIFLLFLLLVLLAGPVLGQEGVVFYGTNTLGSVSAESSQAEFTFGGTEGDLVTIQVIGITAGLDPALSLNSPTQQNLASNDNEDSGTSDARISLSLPQSGAFTILVNSVTGAPGEFLLRLNGHAPLPATEMTDAVLNADIAANSPQLFSFSADSGQVITLNVMTATADFGFQVIVKDANGNPVAMVSGSDIVGVSLPFPPGSAIYTAEITPLDPNVSGQVSIFIGGPPALVQPQAASSVPSPEETEEVASCGITPNGGEVNVRSGPATTFDIIAKLQPSHVLEVTGTANYWYQVIVPDVGTGWVSDTVVFATGECKNISEVEAPQPPPTVETVTATPPVQATPTFTPAPPVQATPTFTPAPPIQATPTFTPAAPQPSITVTQAHPAATGTAPPTRTVTTTPAS